MSDKKDKKKKWDIKNLRKYIIISIIVLVGYLIDKKAFLMFIFIVVEFVAKIIRGQIADSMFMFDPLVFFSILIMKFWGFWWMAFFLFFTVFFADVMAGHITEGSFLNYFLFHLCPFIGIKLFGNFPMAIYGNATSILYTFTYVPIRIKFLGGDPSTYVKGVTNIIFVYLYIIFFGPIFEIIM